MLETGLTKKAIRHCIPKSTQPSLGDGRRTVPVQRRRHNFQSRLLFFSALILGIAHLCGPRFVRAGDEETLEQIRAGYTQTITSMQSIWCKFEVESETSLPNSPRLRIYEWALEEDKFHFSSPETLRPDGDMSNPAWISVDGEFHWQIHHKNQQVTKHRHTDGVDQISHFFTPGRILGHYFNVGLKNLQETNLKSLLETRNLTLVGMEEIAGHDCWRVDFWYPGLTPGDDFPIRIWFDPAAGYLPRRQQLWRSAKRAGRVKAEGIGILSTVLDFQVVIDQRSGREIFFPKTIRYEFQGGSHQLLTVHDVKLNGNLPKTLFRPKVPQGFVTFDLDNQRQAAAMRRKNVTVHGFEIGGAWIWVTL